jgi:hypothetical protein
MGRWWHYIIYTTAYASIADTLYFFGNIERLPRGKTKHWSFKFSKGQT